MNAHEKDYFNEVSISEGKEQKVAKLPDMSCPMQKKRSQLETSRASKEQKGSEDIDGSHTNPLDTLCIVIINIYNFLFIVPNVTNDEERHKNIKNTVLVLIGAVILLVFFSDKVIEINIRPASSLDTIGGVSEDNQDNAVPHVEKILTDESEIFITPDLDAQIAAAVWPLEADSGELSFQSLNTDIVSVTQDGVLTAKCFPAEGESYTTTITIQAEQITKYITVTVFNSKDYPETKEETDVYSEDGIKKP